MKTLFLLALVVATTPAFAQELACTGGGENITVNVAEDKIEVSANYGELARETQDPDCVYRSNRYACYEDGQLMINIPLALAAGKVEKGTIYIQSDTGDNADSHNHALLGAPYSCVTK